ncbi:ABC transporter permease [Microbacterium sp. STN6]|uniref:ABC transporter permease n=1 Tax=Microbacterium sp. STN6 TaxID=2995588 RepID=UPI002260BBE1|nr:ABC transporter permease [Microbacterium sp. STN6]MCX7521242.1 ABC transporter permease [Microbacterium sp. STN6]
MFVALRDLRHARGRFILIGSVVALITLLVGFLGGLTQGLANANISSLTSLSLDRFVFEQPGDGQQLSFSDSTVTREQASTWSTARGVDAAEPIGIATAKATATGGSQTTAALFGVRHSLEGMAGDQTLPAGPGQVVLSQPAADKLDATTGARVHIAGASYRVAAVDGSAQYSHMPVIWMPLADWQSVASAQSAGAAPYATVLAVTLGDGADTAAIDHAAATESTGLIPALLAIDGFRSEIGSLLMMMALLFGISALVIGAFFTVWTLQRLGDIAVLKALGSTTGALVRDGLGQALIVLVVGVGLGIGITAGVGALISGAVPFVVSQLTTLVPAVAMIALGLAGAGFALRSVTRVDPLTALNGQNA